MDCYRALAAARRVESSSGLYLFPLPYANEGEAPPFYPLFMSKPKFLLLQIRNAEDPMRAQEVGCFCRALGCDASQLATFDLLAGVPTREDYDAVDGVLIGGSGDYSAAGEGEWLRRTFAGLRLLHDVGKPTFASCWGFQAFARAMGGRCIHDPDRAELGSILLRLTDAGRQDWLFGQLPSPFLAQAGHEDHVVELPPGAVHLASSDRVFLQAFKFADAPIYCTQFHPELDLETLIQRVMAYPRYVEEIAGVTIDTFTAGCREAPETNGLLRRFAQRVSR
jgi:GMP synthase (glutamine-hydrolysing)